MMRLLAMLSLLLALAATPANPQYLVTWAMESATMPGDGNSGHDFLAVFDISGPTTFGKLVAMVPVPTRAMMAHHANSVMPPNHMFFANDFMAAESYVFDIHDPLKPTIAASFTDAGPYTHPHSFAALSNGNMLATYQVKGNGDTTGALVELNDKGRVVKSSDAGASADLNIRPYGLVVLEKLDRVVTTSAPMPPLKIAKPSHVVQVWRLSDLALLKTVELPEHKYAGSVGQNADDAGVLADGNTVLVKTASCGLYRLNDLAGSDPTAAFVYDFGGRSCSGVPVVAGNYWIQASMSGHNIVSLDVRDPNHPIEASNVVLGPDAHPHWIGGQPGTGNLVITGYGSMLHTIYFANVNMNTGALTLDKRTIDMTRRWPDGWNGPAIPHASIFYQ